MENMDMTELLVELPTTHPDLRPVLERYDSIMRAWHRAKPLQPATLEHYDVYIMCRFRMVILQDGLEGGQLGGDPSRNAVRFLISMCERAIERFDSVPDPEAHPEWAFYWR